MDDLGVYKGDDALDDSKEPGVGGVPNSLSGNLDNILLFQTN